MRRSSGRSESADKCDFIASPSNAKPPGVAANFTKQIVVVIVGEKLAIREVARDDFVTERQVLCVRRKERIIDKTRIRFVARPVAVWRGDNARPHGVAFDVPIAALRLRGEDALLGAAGRGLSLQTADPIRGERWICASDGEEHKTHDERDLAHLVTH